MSTFAALFKRSVRLQAASSSSHNSQLAWQRWQLYSSCKSFSSKGGDGNGDDEQASVTDRGSWRSWVEQQLSGIDQAALKEEQQLTARQLQQQQKAQAAAPDSPQVQQAALGDAQEEVAGYGDEDQASTTPSSESSLAAPDGIEDSAMPADTPDSSVLQQPVSQLSAAEPAEAPSQTQEPEPIIETAAPHSLSQASDLSVDERIDVFLEAIRNRSWEQTGRQPVNAAEGASMELSLPTSGYSELGSIKSGKMGGQVINSGRTFYPGHIYEPADLLANDAPRVAWRFVNKAISDQRSLRSTKDVLASADFKNLSFLNEFVSEGGQIVPRSKTKLQAKVHRHLARQIKTARVMGLLPHAGRLDEFQTGVADLSDDDFDPNGDINDSMPGFRKLMNADA